MRQHARWDHSCTTSTWVVWNNVRVCIMAITFKQKSVSKTVLQIATNKNKINVVNKNVLALANMVTISQGIACNNVLKLSNYKQRNYFMATTSHQNASHNALQTPMDINKFSCVYKNVSSRTRKWTINPTHANLQQLNLLYHRLK